MSSIAGILHFDGRPVEPGQVEAMTAAMYSRGPDGIHHWRKGPVALGQCMLRTTPESLEERQPLANEDESLVLVMDGRVDDYEALRRELLGRGAVLRDRSDAELVLRAYEIWGEDCPDKIIGEYVFFIWDARNRCLFGARDAAGTRHFYYHTGHGWFGFSSGIKGLLVLGKIEPKLNESRLFDYLNERFDRDDQIGTFYQEINRLPAGHAIRVSSGGKKIWRHWNPVNLPAARFGSINECAEAFREQLRIVVKCRLRSNGPVGAMLSGGLDSSSIVGLISKNFRAEMKYPLITFSLIRADREKCHDWRAIRQMLDDDWLDPVVLPSSISAAVWRKYLGDTWKYDEPFTQVNGLLCELISSRASGRGCRVILDGMAGDALFYSLNTSLALTVSQKMMARAVDVLGAYRRHQISGGLRTFIWKGLREFAPNFALEAYRKYTARRSIFQDAMLMPGDLSKYFCEEFYQYLHDRHSAAKIASERARMEMNGNEGAQEAFARRFTTGLISFPHEIGSAIASSNGVELRSPFSDRRILEFGIRMPIEAKLSLGWYKSFLRDSMNDVLPIEVCRRRDLGNHPGWEFIFSFVSAMIEENPKLLQEFNISGALKKLIDPLTIQSEWTMFSRNMDPTKGRNLYRYVILDSWLKDAFGCVEV